jgi:Uma2 family endonuclease
MGIAHFFNAFVIPQNLGYVTGPDGGYKLAAGRIRRPDVGFIAAARNVKLEGVEFDGAPDLAVEVVSPDEDVFKKAREYLHSGAKIVWAVYTDEKIVYVCTLDDHGILSWQPFDINSTLDGGDVLPGFTLAVREVFPG